jgi:glycosyltransferase involved in cell wall biosynthesis
MLRLLALHYRVDVWTKSDEKDTPITDLERYQRQLTKIGVHLLPCRHKYMSEFLAKTYYDVGLFEFYSMAEKYVQEFRHCQPHAKIIIDTVDLHFVREASAIKLRLTESSQIEKIQQRELKTYRGADAVIAISEAEREILLKQGRMPSIYVIPIIMPIRSRYPGVRQHNVLFIGGFRHPPNLDGLQWFMQEIWPLVITRIPDARFTIIGSHPTDEVYKFGKQPGVTVLGYVPDTTPYLDRAMVSVAPLRYGAGMKGKVNEAMASGVPVVTTSIGAQGLQAVSGEHLIIANDPNEFAEAMIKLLQDPVKCERLGLAGQQHTAKLCHPDFAEQTLQEILATLFPTSRKKTLPWGWLRFSIAFHIKKWTKFFKRII